MCTVGTGVTPFGTATSVFREILLGISVGLFFAAVKALRAPAQLSTSVKAAQPSTSVKAAQLSTTIISYV